MAETTTSTARTSKPKAAKPAAGRKPAGTTRSASTSRANGRTAKGTTPAAARRSRTTAAQKTAEAAKADAQAAARTVEESRTLAERAALTYVGATFEARDRVVGTVSDLVGRYGSVEAAEKELARFELRGTQVRAEIERLVRRNRVRAEREVAHAERTAERRPNVVTQRIDFLSNRVEDVLQVSAAVTERVASKAREQVKAIA